MSKHILSLVLTVLIAAVATAAPTIPVEWRTSVVMDSEAGGNIYLEARIADGWHLYGTEIPEGGPLATSFKLAETEGVTFANAVPERRPDSGVDMVFHLRLRWWTGTIGFKIPFSIADGFSPAELSGTINFQAGDNSTCISPRHEQFKVVLNTGHQEKPKELSTPAPTAKKNKKEIKPDIKVKQDSVSETDSRYEKLAGEVKAWKSLSVALMILIVILVAALFYYIGRYNSQLKK